MSGITINNQHYEILGNNLFLNTATKEVLSGDQISENSHIDLGNGNNLQGIRIGNRNTTYTYTLMCPVSAKEWKNISMITLFTGALMGLIGVIGLITSTIPFLACVCTATGILITISAMFKVNVLLAE